MVWRPYWIGPLGQKSSQRISLGGQFFWGNFALALGVITPNIARQSSNSDPARSEPKKVLGFGNAAQRETLGDPRSTDVGAAYAASLCGGLFFRRIVHIPNFGDMSCSFASDEIPTFRASHSAASHFAGDRLARK
jgi:hypothetical protein